VATGFRVPVDETVFSMVPRLMVANSYVAPRVLAAQAVVRTMAAASAAAAQAAAVRVRVGVLLIGFLMGVL